MFCLGPYLVGVSFYLEVELFLIGLFLDDISRDIQNYRMAQLAIMLLFIGFIFFCVYFFFSA